MTVSELILKLKKAFIGNGVEPDVRRNQEAADRLDRAVKEVLSR